MIQVFCSKRGTGKSKKLIEMANQQSERIDGHIVYIDDDNGPMYSLNNSIRFVSTKDYNLLTLEGLSGFLCGILSGDYDISEIYIDGLANIIKVDAQKDEKAFAKLEQLCSQFNLSIYINVNEEAYSPVPEYLKKFLVDAQ